MTGAGAKAERDVDQRAERRSEERRRGGAEAKNRMRLAMIAFLAHAPGLYLFAGRTLEPGWLRLNLIAVAATIAAMVIGALALRDQGLAGMGVAVAFMLGHSAWSLTLARAVLAGRALKDRRRSPR